MSQLLTVLRIYYINEGKFEWYINHQQYILYPGDVALILPGQKFGSEKGFLEIGSLSWMHIKIHKLERGEMIPGKWSSLSETESLAIGKILLLTIHLFFQSLVKPDGYSGIYKMNYLTRRLGYCTRVNQLIDELFITITRQLTKQNNSGQGFSQSIYATGTNIATKSFPPMDGRRNGRHGRNGHYFV